MQLAPHELRDDEVSKVVSVHLNSQQSLFGAATTEGWHVYRTFPFEPMLRNDVPNGSLGIVLPVEESNVVLLVGGPPSALFPENKVVLWDGKLGLAIAELEFAEKVRGIACRRDRLAVALRKRVVLFVLSGGPNGLWREGTYETFDNPLGLLAMATEAGSTLLAFPGRQAGHLALADLPPLSRSNPLPPTPSHDPLKAPYPAYSILVAHTSPIAAIGSIASGRIVATCSNKGTLVRIWDTTTSRLLKELRRGTDQAIIWSLALRPDAQAIALTSDKGTVHIWDLANEDKTSAPPNDDKLSMLKPYLPRYFSSSWSHSQFRLPAPEKTTHSRLPYSLSATQAAQGRPRLTVEDDVAIATWVAYPRPVHRPDKGKGKSTSTSADTSKARVPPETKDEPQVVIITKSGSWYRIALGKSPVDESDMPGRPGYGLSKDATRECRLEEYRRFVQAEW